MAPTRSTASMFALTVLASPALRGLGSLLVAAGGLAAMAATPALADPVICTTTVEAAPARAGTVRAAPVEVTRCGVVETTDTLIMRRGFGWRAPFAAGVNILHQVTDILGIAMGGPEGNRVMGLGFPEQAIIWDGSAIGNSTSAAMEELSPPIPFRTADLPSQFTGSLQGSGESTTPRQLDDGGEPPSMWSRPIRGLW
ncbi:occludin/ELL family protein [Synechococcus sp. ATX 2A4]|uniref:occludin/ELL family protein n=1 Tax=Synechococcus sp. ATX 2A4 TaxID=2823727 RepID=UPI0020CE659B|nr:occludin/ELL family protein [Synechococcus sp. ATX 2A4]MCP9885590.1 occludin/ELL family protein [Synechococcus sp. ATX 2A4]